jgi:hypothetical protein
MQNKITVRAEQTIFDIVLQATGTIESMFEFLEANEATITINVFERIYYFPIQNKGDELLLPEKILRNTSVLKQYQKNNTTISTFSPRLDSHPEL